MKPRMSPEGYVAQRFTAPDGVEQWVLLHWLDDAGLTLTLKTDEEVAKWPELVEAREPE